MPKPEKMGQKNDLVVWLCLQPQQQRIYEVRLHICILAQVHMDSGRYTADQCLTRFCSSL